jgi:hypothetical membrane protein
MMIYLVFRHRIFFRKSSKLLIIPELHSLNNLWKRGKIMKIQSGISSRGIIGMVVITFYIIFTILAYTHYPLSYSPMYNWLSDLGNPDINQFGAAFYNIGIILTALSLFIFYSTFLRIRIKGKTVQNVMTYLTVTLGWIGSLALIMSAIYPINNPSKHSFFCMVLFFCLGSAFAFAVAALRYHPQTPRWLLGSGIIVVMVNMIVQIFFNDVPISEWINVPFLLVYCVVMGFSAHRALSS